MLGMRARVGAEALADTTRSNQQTLRPFSFFRSTLSVLLLPVYYGFVVAFSIAFYGFLVGRGALSLAVQLVRCVLASLLRRTGNTLHSVADAVWPPERGGVLEILDLSQSLGAVDGRSARRRARIGSGVIQSAEATVPEPQAASLKKTEEEKAAELQRQVKEAGDYSTKRKLGSKKKRLSGSTNTLESTHTSRRTSGRRFSERSRSTSNSSVIIHSFEKGSQANAEPKSLQPFKEKDTSDYAESGDVDEGWGEDDEESGLFYNDEDDDGSAHELVLSGDISRPLTPGGSLDEAKIQKLVTSFYTTLSQSEVYETSP